MQLLIENPLFAQVGLGGGGIGLLITGFLVIIALAILGFLLWLLSEKIKSEGRKKKLAILGLILALPFIAFQIVGFVIFGIKYWYVVVPLVVLFFLIWIGIRRRKNKIQQVGGINSVTASPSLHDTP